MGTPILIMNSRNRTTKDAEAEDEARMRVH